MKNVVRPFAIITLFFLSTCILFADDNIINSNESKIIALALEASFKDKDFTIVKPKTRFRNLHIIVNTKKMEKEIKIMKKHIKRGLEFEIKGHDTASALDDFIEKNKQSVLLDLKSNLSKGYVINYEGKSNNVLIIEYNRIANIDDGVGRDRQYTLGDYDKHGSTTVSRPGYDKNTGVVLIYMRTRYRAQVGTGHYAIYGAGYIIGYRYDGHKLEEIGRLRL